MKFLADEDISRPFARTAEAHGHEVLWMPKGITDEEVYSYSCEQRLPILTFDTDFLDTAKFLLSGTPGRIVIRIFPTKFSFQSNRFEVFLTEALPNLELSNHLIELFAEAVVVHEE